MVARHCRLAAELARDLAQEPGIRVLNTVHANQVALTCGETDAETDAVLAEVQGRGLVYPSHGKWAGRRIIRCSIIGYATKDEHTRLLADEIRRAWRKVQEGS